jgi:hypothetical protein
VLLANIDLRRLQSRETLRSHWQCKRSFHPSGELIRIVLDHGDEGEIFKGMRTSSEMAPQVAALRAEMADILAKSADQ